MKKFISSLFKPYFFCEAFESCPDPLENKIKSFTDLPEGWNYGEGKPPNKATVEKAIKIYRLGKEQSFDSEVFPLPDGEIEVSLYLFDHFIDVLVQPDGDLELSYEVGIGSNYKEIESIKNISIEDVKRRLGELRKVCNVLESSATTTTKGKSDSLIDVSEISREEYQSSTANASITSMELRFATISNTFTLQNA